MSTSVTDKRSFTRIHTESALRYTFAAAFLALVGAVYEHFGHGVYSYFMIYAFAFPLLLGTLPALVGLKKPSLAFHSAWARSFRGTSAAVFSVGSILKGVLDIYGTANHLILYYWIFGLLLLCLSVFAELIFRSRREKQRSQMPQQPRQQQNPVYYPPQGRY